MQDFGSWWWLIGLAAAVGILAVLDTMASAIRNGTAMHELKMRVHRLRLKYQAQLRAMSLGDDPRLLPDDPAELLKYLHSAQPVAEVGEPVETEAPAKQAA